MVLTIVIGAVLMSSAPNSPDQPKPSPAAAAASPDAATVASSDAAPSLTVPRLVFGGFGNPVPIQPTKVRQIAIDSQEIPLCIALPGMPILVIRGSEIKLKWTKSSEDAGSQQKKAP